MKRIVCIVCAVVLLAGCDHPSIKIAATVTMRAIVESSQEPETSIKVFVEDMHGNALNAARVIAKDKNNRVSFLEFDAARCVYWIKTEFVIDNVITLELRSNIIKSPVVLEVPHSKVTQKPSITVFQDASGNSVLKGQALQANNEIQIAWDSYGQGFVYTVEIKTALKTLYAVSTDACQIIIPAHSLPKEKNYSLTVSAQKAYGDPLMETYAYYSVSRAKSGGINFELQ